MKIEEKGQGQISAEQVRVMLSQCKVRTLPACKRAGMATSTLLRWERGQTPAEGSVERLKLAILTIAEEKRTLPCSYAQELEQLRTEFTLPDKDPAGKRVADLERRVGRLEQHAGIAP